MGGCSPTDLELCGGARAIRQHVVGETKWRPTTSFRETSERLPRFPIPAGIRRLSYLREVSEQGLRQRSGLQDSDPFEALYGERLAFELQVMEADGLPQPTFLRGLAIYSAIFFCPRAGIPWGPGWAYRRPVLVALRPWGSRRWIPVEARACCSSGFSTGAPARCLTSDTEHF